MKLVKEHIILEKFTQDSDPIDDLGIGMMSQIRKWANTIDKNYNEEDLLWMCAGAGKTEFVKYLLEKGWDVHEFSDYALELAVDDGFLDIVKLLLDAGANANHNNGYILRLACMLGHADIVKLLLDAGADVHTSNNLALQAASDNGHPEIVKILKDHIAKEKKLKESLNENFTEDSDPISDMNIGGYSFETLMPGAVIKVKDELRSFVTLTKNQSGNFADFPSWHMPKEHYFLVTEVKPFKRITTKIQPERIKELEKKDIHIQRYTNLKDLQEGRERFRTQAAGWIWYGSHNRMIVTKLQFNNRFEIIERGF